VNENSATEVCPREDIAAYVDGELSESERTRLEQHVSECETCSRSLMEQRQFLAVLSASLDSGSALPLPKDFTKKVVASAESSVRGIRQPGELYTAIFICAALLIFALFTLGFGSFGLTSGVYSLGEKLFAFGLLVFKLINSLAFAAAVIVRSLASGLDTIGLLSVAGTIFIATVIYFSTRRVLRRRSA
jgi:anti-sigma factor RsiW